MKPEFTQDTKTASGFTFERLSSASELNKIETHWRALHKHSQGNLFTHFDWVVKALRNFKREADLGILCVWLEGQLAACAIFSSERKKVSKRLRHFKRQTTQHYQGLYDGFFEPLYSDSATMHALIDFFIAEFKSHNVLMPLMRDGEFNDAFTKKLRETHRVWVSPKFECSRVLTTDGWDDYKASRSKNFSKSMRKSFRKFEISGGKIEIYSGLDDARQNRIACICRNSWKQTSETGIYSESHRQGFFEEVCTTFSRKDELMVLFFTVEGKDISFAIYVKCNDVYYGIWTDFNEEYERFSPGRLAVYKGLETAFSTMPIACVDMMRRTHFLTPFENGYYKIYALKAAPKYSLSRILIGLETKAVEISTQLRRKKSRSLRRSDVKGGNT